MQLIYSSYANFFSLNLKRLKLLSGCYFKQWLTDQHQDLLVFLQPFSFFHHLSSSFATWTKLCLRKDQFLDKRILIKKKMPLKNYILNTQFSGKLKTILKSNFLFHINQ